MSLLTLLSNQSATQTVVLNRLESTAQIFLPTVIQAGGTQTITLDRLESTAQVFLPTVVQAGGAQTITLNLLGSTAQVFLPTIQLVGAVTDTSDILNRGLKRLRREEESVAAQILKDRNKKVKREEKKKLDWKKAILDKINGAQEIEQLDAIQLPAQSANVTAEALIDLKRKKEEKRLELEAAIKSFKIIQEDILARHEIAVKQASEEEKKLFLDTLKAEKEAEEFTRKRNNRIKRVKALMWLAKLDL